VTSSHTRVLAAALAVAVGLVAPGCGDERTNERWVTTEDATVDIDWDAVGKAYREAEGPRDFEVRVNEIYAGEEVVSVAVKDVDEATQLVTGFFDRDADGAVGEGEEIFTIQRELVREGKGQYQIAGHGPYAGYHSPIWDIAAGMFMGSMMARMFTPGMGAMYATPYVTPAGRRGDLALQRDAWRRANPDKFAARSKSGRAYGKKGGAFGGGRTAPPPRMPSRGGGRFGARGTQDRPAVRLTA
jgi:hypothetical protein